MKETLVTHDKLKVLVHDLVLVELWREEILPRLAKEKLTQTFTIYPILYHESTCINLLETVLYHPETAETLGEAVVDLTDYTIRQMNYFITVGNDDDEDDSDAISSAGNGSGDHLGHKGTTNEDIDINKISRSVLFGNCFKALSTLRYIIENVATLGSGLISRLIISSDSPMLFTQLLLQKPWRRENWKDGKTTEYEPDSGTWKVVDPSDRFIMGRTEIQCWLSLYLLLNNNEILSMYEMYEARKTQLLKLQQFLNEYTVEQLPVLGHFQLFLNQLSVQSGGPFGPSKSPLLLELIAPIRDSLEKEFKTNRKALVKHYLKELTEGSPEIMMEKAQRLAALYDFDNFEPALPAKGVCANCGKVAEKRCSKCKSAWYCTRDCQVKDWNKSHKANCGNEKSN